jgi:ribose 1,5-bisphosphokinase PhnN
MPIWGPAQAGERVWIAQLPRRGRERIQLIAGRSNRKKQQENDVDGITVNRIVINRLAQTDQTTKRLLQVLHAGMRYRNAAADAGASQLLALQDFASTN